jgi:HD superfamily phosphohydrolase
MQYITHGASIECLSANIITRDIKLSSLVEVESIGNCRKYICKRNCEGAILKQLEPKKAIYNDNSHLETNDSIKAEDILVIIDDIIPKDNKVINKSGRHKAQNVVTNCYTYAEITKQFHFIKEIKDPRQLENPSLQLPQEPFKLPPPKKK